MSSSISNAFILSIFIQSLFQVVFDCLKNASYANSQDYIRCFLIKKLFLYFWRFSIPNVPTIFFNVHFNLVNEPINVVPADHPTAMIKRPATEQQLVGKMFSDCLGYFSLRGK